MSMAGRLSLLNQWSKVDSIKLFELKLIDGNDEYEIYNIENDNLGLYINLYDDGIIRTNFDDTFSLDEHIQSLYSDLLEIYPDKFDFE